VLKLAQEFPETKGGAKNFDLQNFRVPGKDVSGNFSGGERVIFNSPQFFST